MYLLSDYDFNLPDKLIAQEPITPRDNSNLIVYNKNTGKKKYTKFYDILNFLNPNDVLVINNTKVVPVRLIGKKDTGANVEVLILDYANKLTDSNFDNEAVFSCLVKPQKRVKLGTELTFNKDLTAIITDIKERGLSLIKLYFKKSLEIILNEIGLVPLPPYIKQEKTKKFNEVAKKSYQTTYASKQGAIAAPTAGFHFTRELLKKIKKKGIEIVEITLHVGYGTFSPVRVTDIRDHKIHSEIYTISESSAKKINKAKKAGSKIIAVGTTCVRTLEYACDENGVINPQKANCDIFIYPGYKFKIVDAMITNFHLPKSTLIMLVSAFMGKNEILDTYKEAIKRNFRFYSFGDAMFIK